MVGGSDGRLEGQLINGSVGQLDKVGWLIDSLGWTMVGWSVG